MLRDRSNREFQFLCRGAVNCLSHSHLRRSGGATAFPPKRFFHVTNYFRGAARRRMNFLTVCGMFPENCSKSLGKFHAPVVLPAIGVTLAECKIARFFEIIRQI